MVQDPPLDDSMAGLRPLGALTLGSAGANALGKQHISIGVRASSSTPSAEPSFDIHTYIHQLERKIDDLTTAVDRDRHVKDELAEIKHLLQISPSHSGRSRDGRRSHHSPPHGHGRSPLVEHRSRPAAKDRLDPPEEVASIDKNGRRGERSRSPKLNPKNHPVKRSAFESIRSVSASSTHPVRGSKGHTEPTRLFPDPNISPISPAPTPIRYRMERVWGH